MSIKIIKAYYGALNQPPSNINGLDITSQVANMVSTGNDDITINNNTVGNDPAVGKHKFFVVNYSVGGEGSYVVFGNEGDTKDLVPPPS